MTAYQIALDSQADCIEVDVSRSSDGVLFALHDRYVALRLSNLTTPKGLALRRMTCQITNAFRNKYCYYKYLCYAGRKLS